MIDTELRLLTSNFKKLRTKLRNARTRMEGTIREMDALYAQERAKENTRVYLEIGRIRAHLHNEMRWIESALTLMGDES